MRIQLRKHHRTEASVLFVALGLASLLILFMYYYLNLVHAQNVAVARSQAWNGAMAAAEAGVEEALAHLNPGVPVPGVDVRATDGWGQPGANYFGPQTRTLAAGSQYTVTFTAASPLTITSTGSVTVAAINATLTRVVQVDTTSVPLFTTALAAKYNIDLNGNNLSTDSYDSANPALSNHGQYDSNRAGTHGDVTSPYGFVHVGNADIRGDLYLGTNGSYGLNSDGSISGNIYKDFNADFPDVVVPVANWLQTTPSQRNVTVNDTKYDYGFTSANPGSVAYYFIQDSGSFSIYVGANVNVRLKLTANSPTLDGLRVAGTATTSGNLTIYATGSSFTIGGNTTVDSGSATNLSLFGTPTITAITFNGNSSFIGTLYAPSAAFTLNGSSKNPDHDGDSTGSGGFMGASVTRSVIMNGPYSFHFDENLLRSQFQRGYLVTAWREL